jgi:hypothetical protein
MRRQLVAMAATGLLCALGATAQAQKIVFDFEGTTTNPLGDNANATSISDYMSEVYSVFNEHSVTVTGAVANPSSSDWTGTGDRFQNDGGFIQNVDGGDFEISFGNYGVRNARFYGFIDEATDGRDFTFSAYGEGYDEGAYSAENPDPSTLVTTLSRDADQVGSTEKQEDVAFSSGWIYFSEPVYLMVFHANGSFDVAIDDLEVLTVPLPAAAWMGLMTLGGLGLARRRRRNRL